MPPKRPFPQEDPPSACSSSEEEKEQPKSTPQISIDKRPSSGKKPHAKSVALSTPTTESVPDDAQSSGEEDYEGSGEEDNEGSESEPSSPEKEKPAPRPSRTADPNIKPMDDASKSKKASVKVSAAAAAPSESAPIANKCKRPAAQTDKDVLSKDSKKMKKKKKKMALDDDDDELEEDTEKAPAPAPGPGDDKKKQLFQRLWTEDDELAILKGMLDYQSKKGTGPSTDMNAFLDFIKKSLHVVDVSRNQLSDKVRRLKKKYLNNAGKGNEVFSKPHEHKAYELSKKIWGGSDTHHNDHQTVNNGGKVGKSKTIVGSPPSKSTTSQVVAVDSKVEVNKSEDEFFDWSIYPHLAHSFQTKDAWIMNMPRMGDSFVNEGVSLVATSKLKELDQKWKKLRMEEIDLFLKRMELIQEQVKLLQDTYNSRK